VNSEINLTNDFLKFQAVQKLDNLPLASEMTHTYESTYMDLAFEEARKALGEGEVPVRRKSMYFSTGRVRLFLTFQVGSVFVHYNRGNR